jgi:hypothetical protein
MELGDGDHREDGWGLSAGMIPYALQQGMGCQLGTELKEGPGSVEPAWVCSSLARAPMEASSFTWDRGGLLETAGSSLEGVVSASFILGEESYFSGMKWPARRAPAPWPRHGGWRGGAPGRRHGAQGAALHPGHRGGV